MRLELSMGLDNKPCCIQQRIRSRLQNVGCAQCIFRECSVNMSGSLPEILSPNLLAFDKLLRGFLRLKIFSNPLSIDVISVDFESVLSVQTLTDYSQRVRSLAFSSYDSERHPHAPIMPYLALTGNGEFYQAGDLT